MNWMDTFADPDGDGYVEYARRTARGLVNQGWKDSHGAIAHADGTLAEPPIALAEVQAYAYAARRGLARLARRLGRAVDAATWDMRRPPFYASVSIRTFGSPRRTRSP